MASPRKPAPKSAGKKKKLEVRALDLAEALARGERSPCYLVAGEESFLREQATEALREALVGADPGLSYTELDGRKASLAEVLDEARTLPFLGAGHRLVVVDRAGASGNLKGFVGEHGEALARFLAAPPDTATLVLVARKLDKRFKGTKTLLPVVTLVDCAPYPERALLGFLRERAKHWGREFQRGADEALLERLGGQDVPLAQIDAEVRKLASAGSGPITSQEVEALASFGSSADSFALIERVARGDAEGALEVLDRLLRDGMVSGGGQRVRDAQGIAMVLIPTLRWDLTRLLQGRALLDAGQRGFDIANELRVFRDKAQFVDRLRRADLDALAARHAVLREADAALRTSASPTHVLTDVVLRLALAERGLVPQLLR
ncbi:MAG: DNA polymerase III subunit delta [Planctomycetota bacterium]